MICVGAVIISIKVWDSGASVLLVQMFYQSYILPLIDLGQINK